MPYVAGGKFEDRPRIGCDRCVSVCWDGPVGPHRKSCGCECTLDGCKHAAPWVTQLAVDEAQRRLREKHGTIVVPRYRAHFRAIARWWELNAKRRHTGVIDDDGTTSWQRDLMYAANYRWLVELMDSGHQVTSDASGVYVDGELATVYMARQIKSMKPTPPRKSKRRHARR